jgi:hypothetical protein
MNQEANIDEYAKDPDLLVGLCRDVIDRLCSGDDDGQTTAMETQLREISRAVEKLEKMGVAVPDVLRAEKTRLAAALGIQAEAAQVLNRLADELDQLVADLKIRLGRNNERPSKKKRHRRSSNSPRTGAAILREHIIKALRKLGGRARVADIMAEMGRQLEGRLLAGDVEWRKATNEYVWQNNAKWERFRMTKDGLLSSDSPHGIWELSEAKQ